MNISQWNKLKNLNYRFSEEREISDLLGIDVAYENQPYESHIGKGGGAMPDERKNRSMQKIGKINKNLYEDS